MKTSTIWMLSAVAFFYGAYCLGPAPTDNNALGFLLLVGSFGFAMTVTVKRSKKQGEAQQARVIACKVLYDKSLFDLQQDPTSSNKHQEALNRGREYYGYIHPNTYDMHQNGMSSNFRDNAGIVEAKVQSDIQTRIGKGKVS